MKKMLVFLLSLIALTSCADGKKFTKKDGSKIYAEPYGWFNTEDKIDGVVYEVNAGNIAWSVLGVETIILPVVLTGFEFYEPVEYNEPTNKVEKE